MSDDNNPRLIYSPAEAAELLGCSRPFIYKLIADGQLPSLKLGRSRRIRHSDLTAMIDAAVQVGSAGPDAA